MVEVSWRLQVRIEVHFSSLDRFRVLEFVSRGWKEGKDSSGIEAPACCAGRPKSCTRWSGRGILPCPLGPGAEVLGEGEMPGADPGLASCPGWAGGGSLAAECPALAWPDRWVESWFAVGAIVGAPNWASGQLSSCNLPPGRARVFFTLLTCSPWGATHRVGVLIPMVLG